MSRSLVLVEPLGTGETTQATPWKITKKGRVWKVIFLRKWMTFKVSTSIFRGVSQFFFFAAGNSRTSTKLGVVWAMVVSVPCRFSQGTLSAVWVFLIPLQQYVAEKEGVWVGRCAGFFWGPLFLMTF